MTSSGETSLLAILLVASSHANGPEVLFCYPPFPNPLPRLSKPVYPKSTVKRSIKRNQHQPKSPSASAGSRGYRSPPSSSSSSSSSSANGNSGEEDESDTSVLSHTKRPLSKSHSDLKDGDGDDSDASSDQDGIEDDSPAAGPGFSHLRGEGPDHLSPTAYSHVLGIENSLLASSLIPGRKEMRDAKLEFVLDHLSFIGHPVHLDRGRSKRNKARDDARRTSHPTQPRTASVDHSTTGSPLMRPSVPVSPKTQPRSTHAASGKGSPALLATPDTSVTPLTPILQAKSLAALSGHGAHSQQQQQQPQSSHQHQPFAAHDRLGSESISSNSPLPPPQMMSSIPSLNEFQLPPSVAHAEQPSLLGETGAQSNSGRRRPRRSSSGASTTATGVSGLEAFNVVLVVDTPPDRHLSNHLQVYYQDIVLKLTAAIKYEELHDGWLSSEAVTALRVREDARDQERPYSNCIEGLIHCSSLCAALAEAFEAISNRKVARLTSLNHHIDIQLIVHDEVFDRDYNASDFPSTGVGRAASLSAAAANAFLRPPNALESTLVPHQTLIPIEDPNKMLQELDHTSSTDLPLTQFLEIMTPTLNFQEYSVLLDISTEALESMVNHLIYWRKARLSNVVSLRNVYAPNPKLEAIRLPGLAEAYSRQFPTLPSLISILGGLRNTQPFVEALRIPSSTGRRSTYLNMLVWLLSKNLVVELRMYYRLIAGPDIKWKATLPGRNEPRPRAGTRPSSDDDAIGHKSSVDELTAAATTSQTRPHSLTDSPNSSNFNLNTPLESPARPGFSQQRQSSAVSSEVSIPEYRPESSPVPIPGQPSRPPSGRLPSGVASDPSYRNSLIVPEQKLSEASIIAEPGEPNILEQRWMAKMLEGKPAEVASNFDKVRPYLNGRCDWEEMLFRSGIGRREVKTVLDSISEHLIVFHH